MIAARAHRAFVAWIASVAFLLASLAPTIAQAVQHDAPGDWMEVCTVMGTKLVAVDGTSGESMPTLPAKHLLEHCPYCSVHASVVGMPPVLLSVPALVALGQPIPELMLVAPRTLFAWATAQPRAPPELS